MRAEDDSPADAYVSLTLYPQKPIPARVRPFPRTQLRGATHVPGVRLL